MSVGMYRYKGTRELGATVEFEDAQVIIDYPTPTTWEADILLEADVTDYNYRFLRRNGNYTPYFSITVSQAEETVQETPAANTLDAWGTRLDTPRLTGEANDAYRDRLLDVFVHRGGAHHVGLLNAITRDLNLTYSDTALLITAGTVSGIRFSDVVLSSTYSYIKVKSRSLKVTNEKQYVTPVTRQIVPDYYVAEDLVVHLQDGTVLDFEYDEVTNTITLFEEYGLEPVYLNYYYEYRVGKAGLTLSELETALEALQSPSGDALLAVTVASGYGSYDATKLQRMEDTLLLENHLTLGGVEVAGLPLRWSDMKITVVWDPEFQESQRSWSGALWNTKVDEAFISLQKTSKQTWGTAVADESIWGPDEFPLHGGQHIDVTFDAPLGYWENPITGTRFDRWQAASLYDPTTGDFLLYKGLRKTDFQSGIGHNTDLKVSIRRTARTRDTLQQESLPVGSATEGDIPDSDNYNGVVDQQ